MPALALLVLLLAAPAPPAAATPPAADVGFVDASFRVDGRVLGARFVELDGDGRLELVVAVHRPERNERELVVYRIDAGGRLEPAPWRTVRVLEDVVAYAWAEVRPDPGRELLMLTRGGVYAYSLAREGYRGNIERLLAAELLYDVPDPRALPEWKYVLEGPDGTTILVPERDAVSLWRTRAAVTAGGDAAAGHELELVARLEDLRGNSQRVLSGAEGAPDHSVSIRLDDDSPRERLFETVADDAPAMLTAGRRYPAPALVDVDGDGRRDLLLEKSGALHVHLRGARGVTVEPTRVEELPAYLVRDDTDVRFELRDLDGDGDVDVLAVLEADADGLENVQVDVLVLLNDGRRLLPEKPDQVLRFQAAELRLDAVDVDRDGRLDLLVRKFELPSLLQTATGLEFRHATLLYFGKRGGGFERKPSVKDERVYNADDVQDVVRQRKLVLDLSGDGVADEVAIGIFGDVTIRRLRKEKGFLRGTSWGLDASPWKRFEVEGSLFDLDVVDANGDGLGDVLSAGRDRVTVLLSRGGRR